jgi:hypothetical protein
MRQVVVTFWTDLSREDLQREALKSNILWDRITDFRIYDSENLSVWLPLTKGEVTCK